MKEKEKKNGILNPVEKIVTDANTFTRVSTLAEVRKLTEGKKNHDPKDSARSPDVQARLKGRPKSKSVKPLSLYLRRDTIHSFYFERNMFARIEHVATFAYKIYVLYVYSINIV